MGIKTADLKNSFTCWNCNGSGTNFARLAKKSYQCNYDQHGKPVPTKFHVREFECKSCNELVYTVDDGTNIVKILSEDGDVPPMGFKEFNFCFLVDDNMLFIGAFLNGSIPFSGVAEDDIRDESMLFFSEYFKENGVQLNNVMENYWEIRLKDANTYPDAGAIIDHITSLITKAGGKMIKMDPNASMEAGDNLDKEVAKQRLQSSFDNGSMSISDLNAGDF